MNNLYERILAERDSLRPTSETRIIELEVLSQLLVIAFENALQPDTLPNYFIIKNVRISKHLFIQIFERLNIKANISKVSLKDGKYDYIVRLL